MQKLRIPVFSSLLTFVGPLAQAQTYTVFTIPGAQSIGVSGIYAGGQVAGSWHDASFVYHGFIRSASGSITNVDVPSAVHTYLNGINAFGDTVGSYIDNSNFAHGFKRDGSGNIQLLDFPGALSTVTSSINDSGEIAGFLPFTLSNPAFIRDVSGSYTSFAVPGSMNVVNFAIINNDGYVAGNANEGAEAFVRTPRGKVLVSVPQIASTISTLNNANEVGGFVGTIQTLGFVRIAGGKTETFQVNESSDTMVNSLNDSGTAVGFYFSAAIGEFQGFIRTADGVVMPITVPVCGSTYPTSINASAVVAGVCGSNGSTGFIYTQ